MQERRDDLNATMDDVAADATELQAIEAEKRPLDPADPEADRLSAEAEGIARKVLAKTIAERELFREITRD